MAESSSTGVCSSATSMRHASTATSWVAEASAAITAKMAKVPILVVGFVAASPAKAKIMIDWHITIQLFRRPTRSSSGSFSRSTSGDHRNLKL